MMFFLEFHSNGNCVAGMRSTLLIVLLSSQETTSKLSDWTLFREESSPSTLAQYLVYPHRNWCSIRWRSTSRLLFLDSICLPIRGKLGSNHALFNIMSLLNAKREWWTLLAEVVSPNKLTAEALNYILPASVLMNSSHVEKLNILLDVLISLV